MRFKIKSKNLHKLLGFFFSFRLKQNILITSREIIKEKKYDYSIFTISNRFRIFTI